MEAKRAAILIDVPLYELSNYQLYWGCILTKGWTSDLENISDFSDFSRLQWFLPDFARLSQIFQTPEAICDFLETFWFIFAFFETLSEAVVARDVQKSMTGL